MTETEAPRMCRSLLEGGVCYNKPKFAVTEVDGAITYCCAVHKQEALDEGLAVDYAS